jgi:hypothetical protein
MGKHDKESQGAKARDHVHPDRPYWRRAHRDWRVWIVVVLMVGLVLVYVMSGDLSSRAGKRPIQATPAANAP